MDRPKSIGQAHRMLVQMEAEIERLTTKYKLESSSHDTTIGQRDRAEEWADKLAYTVAEYFGADIGEHSNMNCPWQEALDAIPEKPASTRLAKKGLVKLKPGRYDDVYQEGVRWLNESD